MEWKTTIAIILLCIIILGGFIALIFGGGFLNLFYRQTFEPANKEIDRQVWEQTTSRVQGAIQEINKRMLEYNKAETQEEKNAICSYLRTSYPNLSPDQINDYKLRMFFENCKYGG